jgi:hypothetical protein
MIDCHTAVDNAGCNFYSRIHAWMTVKHIEGSIFFKNHGGLVYLSQCFSDSFDKSFDIVGVSELHIFQFRLFHNKLMWKAPYDRWNSVLFHYKDRGIAQKSVITLMDSNIGGLFLDGKNRQVFSNMSEVKIKRIGTVIAN